METVAFLGRTLGFSFAAGVNLYATVALIGLASRYGWVSLPPEYAIFDNNYVIGAAIALYVLEFFADKIPWLDTLWDAVHTFIRPAGGALMAVASLGEASPATQTLIGLIGGAVAAGSHATKAGTRLAVNTSPEPFSNWLLSVIEDIFALGLGLFSMLFPIAAFVLCLLLLAAIAYMAARLLRAVRRWIRGPAPA